METKLISKDVKNPISPYITMITWGGLILIVNLILHFEYFAAVGKFLRNNLHFSNCRRRFFIWDYFISDNYLSNWSSYSIIFRRNNFPLSKENKNWNGHRFNFSRGLHNTCNLSNRRTRVHNRILSGDKLRLLNNFPINSSASNAIYFKPTILPNKANDKKRKLQIACFG